MAESSALRDVWRQAHALVAGGDLAEARRLLAVAIRGATVADDPEVLETRLHLAEVHYGLGSLPDARNELEEALATGTARFGEAHPITLALSARLGAVTEEIGNRYEARRNFSQVARLGPAILGLAHPAVRLAETYLAKTPAPAHPTARAHPPAPAHPAAPASPITRAHPLDDPDRPGRRPRIPVASERRRRSRRTRVMIVSVATATAVLAGVAATLVIRHHPPAVRALPGAPRDVAVRAHGGAVTVTWVDPTPGTAPFIVAGGVAGQPSRLRQQIPAGQTGVTINGLNSTLDYCFTVVAVYGTENFAISDLVCTHRGAAQH